MYHCWIIFVKSFFSCKHLVLKWWLSNQEDISNNLADLERLSKWNSYPLHSHLLSWLLWCENSNFICQFWGHKFTVALRFLSLRFSCSFAHALVLINVFDNVHCLPDQWWPFKKSIFMSTVTLILFSKHLTYTLLQWVPVPFALIILYGNIWIHFMITYIIIKMQIANAESKYRIYKASV